MLEIDGKWHEVRYMTVEDIEALRLYIIFLENR